MDEELPYADDIPSEEQIPDNPEQPALSTLKERIGNRIYLLEDSRKRKITGTERNEQNEDEDVGDADADLTHRSNALLLQGPPISQLPTARVFAYATHFDAHPIGLEWVDDQTCVLVFTSHKHALQALDALRRQSHPKDSTNIMQTEDEEEIGFVGPPLPLALYPIEERINSALATGTQKSHILKETINIRWARANDVKQPGARGKSEFYKKHGETAGKDGLAQILPHKRRRYNDDDNWDARRKLDADLDSFLEGRSEGVPPDVNTHAGEKRKRSEDETRRQLDDELDSFLAQGSEPETLDKREPEMLANSGGRSLMDRTKRAPPRRGRRRRRNSREIKNEGENGRWLHNAEIRQRLPTFDYDEEAYGMRAWREESGERRPAGRIRKPRKTQEDLDRELEEFLDK